MDGEDVVSHPGHVRPVAVHEPLELIHDRAWLPAAVRLAEDFVAAPAAMVGAAARRDQRDRAHAVILAPDLNIARDIDGLAQRPGLPVEIGDLGARRRPVNRAVLTEESDPVDACERLPRLDGPDSTGLERRQQLLYGDFALADHYDVRSAFQVFLDVGPGLRPAGDGFPSRVFRGAQDFDDVRPRHQVPVHAEHRRRVRAQQLEKLLAPGKRGVEDLHGNALGAQVRGDVEDSQRNIGLHHLKFLGVLVEEVAVGEQQVHRS